MKHTLRRVVHTILLLAVAAVAPAAAQGTTGTISGAVADQTGAALPGAAVAVRNVDTGVTRAVVSDSEGRYRVLSVEPGTYEVTGDLQGFQRAVRGNLTLTIGQEAIVNLTLSLGQLEESVVVTESAPLVDTTTSSVATLVDERQIRELPLNGRDFSQLTLLTPGVVQTPTVDRSLLRGMGTQVSVAGARPNMVSYQLDGTDIADQGGQSPGSAAGGLLGVETVREFQVITNNYSAEYGRSAGGIVTAVTRSGTNMLRGGVFEFHRNDALDAREYFDDPNEEKPELTRNQYGFNLGGPFRKDQTFFFGSYEGLRQDRGGTNLLRVPSRATRARTDMSPITRPYLLLYPEPNVSESGATGLYSVQLVEPTREDYFVVKIDHTFSDKDSGSIRYTFDDASTEELLSFGYFSNEHQNRNQYVTLEHKHLFTGALLNDLRVAFNRTFQATLNVDNKGIDESMWFIPGTQFGALGVSGIDGYGTDTSVPYLLGFNVLQIINHTTWTKGRHTLKAGGNFTRWFNNQNATFTYGGNYTFTSLEDFVLGRPNNFESTLPGSASDRYWRQNLFGFFAQDDWALTSRLTLNLGLRYEFVTEPKEKYDRVASFRNPPYDLDPVIGYPLFANPSLTNVAPRFGFAWDVMGDSRTSVRGGAGLFHEPILANIYRTFGNRTPPFFAQASLRNPPFPRAVAVLPPTSGQRLDLLQWDLVNPYVMQFNLTAQREVLPQLVAIVGYVGSRGLNLFRNIEANQAIPQVRTDGSYFFPVGSVRRSGNWASVRQRLPDGNSWYNGMVAGITKRFSAGLQLQGSYTFGRVYDEGSISAGSQDFNNGFQPPFGDDRHMNYGPADYDVRHNFVFNYSYTLPFGQEATGARRALAAGWQLTGILTMRSGVPFTPQLGFDRARALPRSGGGGQWPDLAAGCSNNPVLGGTEMYFDVNCFTLPEAGTFGNVGRNTVSGPGYATWDSAVFKNFELGGRRRLQIRLEAFNILNRANFSLPANTVFNSAGRVDNAGEITDTVGTARQFQIGAKFEF
jgi:hypothetical protein